MSTDDLRCGWCYHRASCHTTEGGCAVWEYEDDPMGEPCPCDHSEGYVRETGGAR